MITKDKKLNIIYRFKDYEYLVFCSDNNFWQLEHFENNRTKKLRILKQKKIGCSICILYNRKPLSIIKLRKLAIKTFEFLTIETLIEIPF